MSVFRNMSEFTRFVDNELTHQEQTYVHDYLQFIGERKSDQETQEVTRRANVAFEYDTDAERTCANPSVRGFGILGLYNLAVIGFELSKPCGRDIRARDNRVPNDVHSSR